MKRRVSLPIPASLTIPGFLTIPVSTPGTKLATA
jgi:hypothetical protein